LLQRALNDVALGGGELRADLRASFHAPPSQDVEALEVPAQGLQRTGLDLRAFLLLPGAEEEKRILQDPLPDRRLAPQPGGVELLDLMAS
jgi:hypothetical protein